ncbi:FAD binding domain-containing protein [Mycena crocata]|nr:FAD binding domain-containing protein [Mycena crocata]
MWGEIQTNRHASISYTPCVVRPGTLFCSVYLRPTEVPGLFGLMMSPPGLVVDHDTLIKDRDLLIATITGRSDMELVDVQRITQWTPNIRMVDKFSAGRCFVAGDAAHVQSPTGSQCLKSSVRDSFNPAWKLALVLRGAAPIKLLDLYTDERLPVIQEMLSKSTGLLNRTVRVADQDTTSHWERGGPLLMLGVHYRWSPIVVDEQDEEPAEKVPADTYGAPCAGRRTGDYAPDAPGLQDRRSGESGVRLFDLFDTTRHTVLVFSADPGATILLWS